MIKYNLHKLIKASSIDFKESSWYYYYKGRSKKYFWQENLKEGVYTKVFGQEGLVNLPKNFTMINRVVYENPCVSMLFEGNTHVTRYFTTLKEANLFLNSITKGKYWKSI